MTKVILIIGEGGKKILNLIKGESLIRASRVENFSKINKQASPFVMQVRVALIFDRAL